VIDVRHVGFDMSDNRSDGDRCNKKGHKTKDQVTRIPLKTGGELRCSGRISRSCRVNLLTNPYISRWIQLRKNTYLPLLGSILEYVTVPKNKNEQLEKKIQSRGDRFIGTDLEMKST
jgi:hypothetical protein